MFSQMLNQNMTSNFFHRPQFRRKSRFFLENKFSDIFKSFLENQVFAKMVDGNKFLRSYQGFSAQITWKLMHQTCGNIFKFSLRWEQSGKAFFPEKLDFLENEGFS